METQCRRCGSVRTAAVEGPAPGEYRRLECDECGRFIKWLPKPGNVRKPPPDPADMTDIIGDLNELDDVLHQATVANLDNDFFKSVRKKSEGMRKYAEAHGGLGTQAQCDAIGNMIDGVQKWLHR